MKAYNSKTDIELRRERDMLRICGIGVIVFGVWNIVKFIIMLMLSADVRENYINDNGTSSIINWIIFGIVFALLAVIIIGFRYYVGGSAIKESHDGKGRKLYLIAACLLVISSIASLISYISKFLHPENRSGYGDDGIVSFFVELTSLSTSLCLIRSGYRVRKLSAEITGKVSVSAGEGGM